VLHYNPHNVVFHGGSVRSLDASSGLGMKVFFTRSAVEGLNELTPAKDVVEVESAPEIGVLNKLRITGRFSIRNPWDCTLKMKKS
jgi:hypothetical protein